MVNGHSPQKTTWTLTNPHAPVITVNLYGTVFVRDVTAWGITALPHHVSATVIPNTNGTAALTSHKLGALSYQLPTDRSAKWLGVGRPVTAVINPESHAVLQLMPKHVRSWHKTAKIAQGNTVKVVYPGHSDTTRLKFRPDRLSSFTSPLKSSWSG